MKKFLFAICLISMLIFASCSDIAVKDETTSVSLEIVREKTLDAVRMDAVSYYTYDAATTSVSAATHGTATNAILIVESNGKAQIGKLSQGIWTFTVHAFSERDTELYTGSVTMDVAGSDISAKIVLSQTRTGYGYISLDITTRRVDSEIPNMGISWIRYSDGAVIGSSASRSNPLWTVTEIFDESDSVYFGERSWDQATINALRVGAASEKIGNSRHVAVNKGDIIRLKVTNTTNGTTGWWFGKVTEGCSTSTDPWATLMYYTTSSWHVRYQASGIDVPAGRYRLKVAVGSESNYVDVMIVEGETTHVSGMLAPGQYIDPMIDVDTVYPEGPTGVRRISGKILYNNTPAYGTATTYTWVSDEGSDTVTRYIWSVNGQTYVNGSSGTLWSTGSTFSYTPSAEGVYTISCCATIATGESASDSVMFDLGGAGWQPLGLYQVKDYGSSYGTYTTSYTYTGDPNPKVFLMKTTGAGGRYLGLGGTVTGSGTTTNPYIIWAPYVGGTDKTAALQTSTADRMGKANTKLLRETDSLTSSHTSGGTQVVSLGGAITKLNDPYAHIPSYNEMVYVMNAVNNGSAYLPANSRWWTSSEDPSSTSNAYVLYVNGSGSASMITMSKTSTSPGLLYVYLI